ncbi:hypothetical protein SDC9_182062 [bioreactor metagenome]|uniref:Uncharacterized protein n=1 Tax=bioreactor metagenome TaxID=1076179 RepID=A0A645H6E8_9ZZZZ
MDSGPEVDRVRGKLLHHLPAGRVIGVENVNVEREEIFEGAFRVRQDRGVRHVVPRSVSGSPRLVQGINHDIFRPQIFYELLLGRLRGGRREGAPRGRRAVPPVNFIIDENSDQHRILSGIIELLLRRPGTQRGAEFRREHIEDSARQPFDRRRIRAFRTGKFHRIRGAPEALEVMAAPVADGVEPPLLKAFDHKAGIDVRQG